jgi:hypothetical protein
MLLNLLQPLNFMHAGGFPKAGHDLFEMFEVGDVEDDLDAGLTVFGVRANVADVALGIADDAGDVFQHSKLVVAIDRQLHGISRGRALIARQRSGSSVPDYNPGQSFRSLVNSRF